jgi:hypothetical protein
MIVTNICDCDGERYYYYYTIFLINIYNGVKKFPTSPRKNWHSCSYSQHTYIITCSSSHCPSAICAFAAVTVCKPTDIFRSLLLNVNILNWFKFLVYYFVLSLCLSYCCCYFVCFLTL